MSKHLLLKKLLARTKKKSTWMDKLLFAILGIGFLLMVAFFAYLIWFTLSNRSVTLFLPAEKTVAYFEAEDLNLPPKLSQDTLFDLLGASALLDKSFGLNPDDIQDIMTQGRFGFALIKSDTKQNKLTLFFRARNKNTALAYFKGLGLTDEALTVSGEGRDLIYSYPQSRHFSFSFIGPYLFLAQDANNLKLIQSVRDNPSSNLNNDSDYLKSLSNLPRQTWGRGYLNIKSLDFGSNASLNQLAAPFQQLLNHLALTIRKQPNGFHFNSLVSIDPSLLSLKKGFTDETRFAYSLADYIGSKRTAFYVGGANLSDEWENTLDSISHLNPAYGIILEGLLRAQLSKLFGETVSLRNDIYPLFNGEYAFVLEEALPNEDIETVSPYGFKLILKHNNVNLAKAKLAKLLEGFSSLAAQYAPKIKSFELPDGTESSELVADPSRLKLTNETYEDYEIHCTDVEGTPYGFCYTINDQMLILSNHPDSIKESVDLSLSPKFVLSQSQPFRQSLSDLSAISDEISYVSLDNANRLFETSPVGPFLSNALSPFSAVTWIKHYFNDGMATEGFLLLK